MGLDTLALIQLTTKALDKCDAGTRPGSKNGCAADWREMMQATDHRPASRASRQNWAERKACPAPAPTYTTTTERLAEAEGGRADHFSQIEP